LATHSEGFCSHHLEGFAITSVRIEGVDHEFSTIKGVVEDVTELVLNIKKIRFKRQVEDVESEKFTVNYWSGAIRAGDLNNFLANFQVLNPDVVICNMEPGVNLVIEFTIEKGRGYVACRRKQGLESTYRTDRC
jgi:DNA-directed RNA polymerase subunit alpha